jgi:hypothetical protein
VSPKIKGHPNFWLLTERLENWNIDNNEGFTRFGVPDYTLKKAKTVKAGDFLVVYVSSKISAFSDIRQALSDGTTKLLHGGDYDTAFSSCLKTKPYITLDRDKWIAIKGLVNVLSFTKDKKDWRQVMRQTIKSLSTEDGKLILSAMKKVALEKETVEKIKRVAVKSKTGF